MKQLKQMFEKWLASRKSSRSEKRKALRAAHSRRLINVREYDNSLYICCDGIPTVPVDKLNCDASTALSEARTVFVKYYKDITIA